jgi:LAO/AO transport system kinase
MSDALDALRRGGKAALARALAQIEARPDGPAASALLDAAWAEPKGHALGLTGPPGVGKSTLIDALIRRLRAKGQTVGVIAVDPSSRVSRGALLGDRTRFSIDPEDQGVFVRSMAARDRLGGLAEITFPALVLMRAVHDVVIVETVGIGQSETEIVDIADTVLFCAQPGSGDALQFMKAGVMEIPHIVVVTKGDMGAIADRAVADLQGALSLAVPGEAPVPVIRCSAARDEGLEDVIAAVEARRIAAGADGRLEQRRAAQMRHWVRRAIVESHGSRGLGRIADALEATGADSPAPASMPFATVAMARQRLDAALTVGFGQQVAPQID